MQSQHCDKYPPGEDRGWTRRLGFDRRVSEIDDLV